nr:hypothetical protein ICEMyc226_00212 [Mycolicibacterium sp.]
MATWHTVGVRVTATTPVTSSGSAPGPRVGACRTCGVLPDVLTAVNAADGGSGVTCGFGSPQYHPVALQGRLPAADEGATARSVR